jgi:hypothetical protein
MSTSTKPTGVAFDFNYFLAEIERSDGAEIFTLFKAAMSVAGLSFADPDNMTLEAASTLLAQARTKHAARSS